MIVSLRTVINLLAGAMLLALALASCGLLWLVGTVLP